jgi:hypothetical protein
MLWCHLRYQAEIAVRDRRSLAARGLFALAIRAYKRSIWREPKWGRYQAK